MVTSPSDACIALIKKSEGLSLKAYLCPAGKLTIGYGHVIRAGEGITDQITQAKADALLAADAQDAYRTVVRTFPGIALTQGMVDALTDFVFNLGGANLASSTMAKHIKARNFTAAAAELPKWNKATVNGKKVALPGLTTRREAERKLFLS